MVPQITLDTAVNILNFHCKEIDTSKDDYTEYKNKVCKEVGYLSANTAYKVDELEIECLPCH